MDYFLLHAEETVLAGDFNTEIIIPDNVILSEIFHVFGLTF